MEVGLGFWDLCQAVGCVIASCVCTIVLFHSFSNCWVRGLVTHPHLGIVSSGLTGISLLDFSCLLRVFGAVFVNICWVELCFCLFQDGLNLSKTPYQFDMTLGILGFMLEVSSTFMF